MEQEIAKYRVQLKRTIRSFGITTNAINDWETKDLENLKNILTNLKNKIS